MKKHAYLPFILFTLILILAAHATSQSQNSSIAVPHRQSVLPRPSDGWRGYWDKGFFATFDDYPGGTPSKPEVIIYDRSGHVVRQGTIWFKDAVSVSIIDVALSDNGDLFVAGGTQNESGVIANFIASVGNDGQVNRVVRTTPFLPAYICTTGDGTVWSYGIDRDDKGERIDTSLMLRHYTFASGQIAAMLDMSSLNSPGWRLLEGRYPGDISLRCNSRKLGLLNAASNEYVELDIASNVLKVAKVEPLPPTKQVRITGFALTESGDVFVSMHDRSTSQPRSGIFKLTFDASGFGTWIPTKNTIGPYLHGGPIERLLGADGDDLVYTHDQSGEAFWSEVK